MILYLSNVLAPGAICSLHVLWLLNLLPYVLPLSDLGLWRGRSQSPVLVAHFNGGTMIAQNDRVAAVSGTNCYPCISEKSRLEGHTVLSTFPSVPASPSD